MLKTYANTLPDEPVCDCPDCTPKRVLDAQLADLQAYLEAGGCLRAWFLDAGIVGLVATAMLTADESGLLIDANGDDCGLTRLRNSLLPHITGDLMTYATLQIGAMWAAPEAVN